MITKALPAFVLSIAIIAITNSAAQAQTHRKVALQASVPYEFVVGNRTLPAGNYVFEMATGSPKSTDQAGVLVVHDYQRKLYVAVATGVENDSNTHVLPRLVFLRNGDRVYLSKVWRRGDRGPECAYAGRARGLARERSSDALRHDQRRNVETLLATSPGTQQLSGEDLKSP